MSLKKECLYYHGQLLAGNYLAKLYASDFKVEENTNYDEIIIRLKRIKSFNKSFERDKSDLSFSLGYHYTIFKLLLYNFIMPIISVSSVSFILFFPLHIINSKLEITQESIVVNEFGENTQFEISGEIVQYLENEVHKKLDDQAPPSPPVGLTIH